MTAETFIEIPRVFTAIAEILACMIYVIPLNDKYRGVGLYMRIFLGIFTLINLHLLSKSLPIILWIPGMLLVMLAMFLFIKSITGLDKLNSGLLFVRAFILAEFAAAFEWQIYYYYLYRGNKFSDVSSIGIMILVYGIVFFLAYYLDARKVRKDVVHEVKIKELINALIIGLVTFSMNNINFIIENPFVSKSIGANILYIRTLVDLSGLLLLYAWNEQRREMHLNHEILYINEILHKHYDQYKTSRESIDLISRKHHDLKHQIELIRAEKNPEVREKYLHDIDQVMNIYDTFHDTGNSVVDTILTEKSQYCKNNDIRISCAVDGKLLDFISVMDICSIFGNAIDNSIEYTKNLKDKDQRIIKVAVYCRNNFLMMRFENYFNENLIFNDGLPVTTKKNKSYHGYGLKSIKNTIEKYDGNFTLNTDNEWFTIKILIPLQ